MSPLAWRIVYAVGVVVTVVVLASYDRALLKQGQHGAVIGGPITLVSAAFWPITWTAGLLFRLYGKVAGDAASDQTIQEKETK